MKYLALLLLVSCSSNQPNCTVRETGEILNKRFSILECRRPIICDQNDTECQVSTNCIQNLNKKLEKDGYLCIERK